MTQVQRGPVVVCVAVVLATAALLPVGAIQFGPTQSYLPAILAVVAC